MCYKMCQAGLSPLQWLQVWCEKVLQPKHQHPLQAFICLPGAVAHSQFCWEEGFTSFPCSHSRNDVSDGGCKYINEIHQWRQTFSFPYFSLCPSHCRWSFIPSRQLSFRWWKKASRWRLDNIFLSNVQQCLNWNGIHLHWLLLQKRITSAFTSVS